MTKDDREVNKELVRRFIAAYVQRDHATALELLGENVIWTLHALPGHFRFGGRWEGMTRVRQGLSMVAADYTIHRYDIVHIVGEGDTVWTTSRLAATHRMTERPVDFEIAARWKIRDGKIVAATEYFDSATVLTQQGDVPEDVRGKA